jgi:thiamine transporter ThiT
MLPLAFLRFLSELLSGLVLYAQFALLAAGFLLYLLSNPEDGNG